MRYWLAFVRGEHRREIDFLLSVAKLGKRPRKDGEHWIGWNNVMKHNVGEAAAMRVICQALGIHTDEAERLETYAFIHNPLIHLQKYRQKQDTHVDMSGFPPSETFTMREASVLEGYAGTLAKEVDPDRSLRCATSPEFFDYIAGLPGKTFDEKLEGVPGPDFLTYYVDALFDDGNLLSAHDRIAKMEKRRPDLNEDVARTERLGMRYWDAERLASSKFEEIIWICLKDQGIHLASPAEVPGFIRAEIARAMHTHWQTTHPAPQV